MAGSTATVDYVSGGRLSTEDMSGEQRCHFDESHMELRSSGQVENGTPSTSPLYLGTDDDDGDRGLKPSALYGKFTWKIEKFSQINKRELRSNTFEVGGYKWYILIYPQGCDVCNHLSLFLCVANHDKLLPGWSHFAQFTIAVVNKDPKKSKYSDTLHRFWKKEHDWGWKKFIELSKVWDGFITDDDYLEIKAQVQVIREKANRPFRCLDYQYRRELVRVYLLNVEQICRRFIEDRKGKFSKLIEDKVRWSSFRSFWLGVDETSRRRMSRDKTDAVLRLIVKHFFVEKEVTSTLVMDSLYSGLKALECEMKNSKGKIKIEEMVESPASIVHIESDMFVLADEVLPLLERVALGPFPLQPLAQDGKGSLNRTKEGSSGEELNKASIERDERHLTEFGWRTLEFFVLAHIFSRIEVAYKEAVALKRQEELIREEEAAEQAENELKAKHRAIDKEKRAKKKQAKQRRASSKIKDREKNEKSELMTKDTHQEQSPSDESFEEFSAKQELRVIKKSEALEKVSITYDTGDDVIETVDLKEKDCSFDNWDVDAIEVHPIMEPNTISVQYEKSEKLITSIVDDSSSTCSTDSVPAIVSNRSCQGHYLQNNENQAEPNRRKNKVGKDTQNRLSDASSLSSTAGTLRPETDCNLSLNDRRQFPEHPVNKHEVSLLQKELNVNDKADIKPASNSTSSSVHLTQEFPRKSPHVLLQQPNKSSETTTTTSTTSTTARKITITNEAIPVKTLHSSSLTPFSTPIHHVTRSSQISTETGAEIDLTPAKNTTGQQATSMSRPSSAPLIPAPMLTGPSVSTAQAVPLLSRSVSSAGRLGTQPSPSALPFVPQSYRNAITGKNDIAGISAGFIYPSLTPSSQAFVSSVAIFPPQTPVRKEQALVGSGLNFGSTKQQIFTSQRRPRDGYSCSEPSSSKSDTNTDPYNSNIIAGMKQTGIYSELEAIRVHPSALSADEFPHLDIINDLLDEDKGIAKVTSNLHNYHHPHPSHHPFLDRCYSSGEADLCSFSSPSHVDQTKQYYNGRRFQRVFSAFENGQAHRVIPNQWPHSYVDLPMMSLRSAADASGRSYDIPDYSNGVNGHMYTQPGNGL